MAQRAGRITCPRCGANNFDTVTTCWKCSTPLGSSVPMPSASPAPGIERPSVGMGMPAMAPVYAPASMGDFGAAKRAALALALTMPWIGLPVGWIFMMIEDARRQAIGRFCATWSLIGLVFHLLFMFAAAQATGQLLLRLLPTIESMQRGQNGLGGSGNETNLGLPGRGQP